MEKLTREEALGRTQGTCLKGHLYGTTYNDLVNLFGEPTFPEPSGDDKVQVTWVIEHDEEVFTIYDWKTYSRQETTEELTEWNVGAKVYAGDFITMVETKLTEINKA